MKPTLKQQFKLPTAFKTKWVKALRSGKYKQGIGKLKQTTFEGDFSYCCLGVAGELCGYDGLYSEVLINIPNKYKVPKALIGDAVSNKLVQKLAPMNDNGKSFKYIASYIERYL